jgi:hypothetical protein
MSSLENTASWVIVETATNRPVIETWQPLIIGKINREKYHAVPIVEWLAGLSKTEGRVSE